MIRKLTSAFAAIGILGTWGFMAYFGLPKGLPWFLKPIGVVWSVAPFFSINLLAMFFVLPFLPTLRWFPS